MHINRRGTLAALGAAGATMALAKTAYSQTVPSPVIQFRAAPPTATVQEQLGPLAELRGTWVGRGFSLVALPNGEHGNKPLPFFLKLNNTVETLTFTPIGGAIPNRGFDQKDISFLGLHYLQQVSDAVASTGMHVEPGLWLNLPVTTAPSSGPTLARLGTIPHGDALLAQGPLINNGKAFPGGPKIQAVDSTPFTVNATTGARQNDTNAIYLDPYKNPTNLPPGVTANIVANPNQILLDAIKGQNITETIVLQVNANPVGGINATPVSPPLMVGSVGNIPFVTTNANANSFSTIFWIETVKNEDDSYFLQLQYTQTVILEFAGLKWPHIAVATLVKQ